MHAFETDELLLQPQIAANALSAQIVIQAVLLIAQPRQVACKLMFLSPPERLGCHQRSPVHQKTLHFRKAGAQLIKDGEAVSIDVAPVVQLALLEPAVSIQHIETIAGAEQHQTAVHCGKARGSWFRSR